MISRRMKSNSTLSAIGITPSAVTVAVSSTGRTRWLIGDQHRLDRLDAVVAAVVVVGVGQHDAVLHHDAGEGDDAQACHDHRERHVAVIASPSITPASDMPTVEMRHEHLPEAVVLEQQHQEIMKITAAKALPMKAPVSAFCWSAPP